MTEVIFPESIGGNGQRFHDGVGEGGMAEGGHASYFFPLMQQILAVALQIAENAQDAQDAANTALNAPGTQATTNTPVTVSTGAKSIVLNETDKAFIKSQRVKIASDANVANFVEGPITDFAGTSMTINADTIGGSGSFSDGIVTPAGGGGVPGSRRISTSGLATGGGDLSANRTISVARATPAQIRQWSRTDVVITPGDMAAALAEVQLQFGQNITTPGDAVLDGSRFIDGFVFMAGNAFLPNLTAPTLGQTYRIVWIQDSVGNRKVTGWGSAYHIEGGKAAFDLSSGPGMFDFLYIDVITPTYYHCSFSKNPTN